MSNVVRGVTSKKRRVSHGQGCKRNGEKSGLDVEELIGKLIAAAGAEFTTFYYYTILRVSAIGMDGEGLKMIVEDARIEDRNHFEALFPRIYELGASCRAIFVIQGLLGNIEAKVCGKAMMELAKMTGMTPPVLTRSGRCVD